MMSYFALLIGLVSMIASLASADLNFTIAHYSPGTQCAGEPFQVNKWSKVGPNSLSCETNGIPTGLIVDDTPKAYQAYCEKQTLALFDTVRVLRLGFYYLNPVCASGANEDETPRDATVGVPGLKCHSGGELFPKSDVKVFHDCDASAAISFANSKLLIVALSAVCFLLLTV